MEGKTRFSKNYTLKNQDSGLKLDDIIKESKISIRQRLKKSSLENIKGVLDCIKSDSCVNVR